MDVLAGVPLVVAAVAAAMVAVQGLQLAWSTRRTQPLGRGSLIAGIAVHSGLAFTQAGLAFRLPEGEGRPASLTVVVVAVLALSFVGALEATRAFSAHTVGAGVLADNTIHWRGATRAARVRRRLDRTLRRQRPGPARDATHSEDRQTWRFYYGVLSEAAERAGRGDPSGAVDTIDTVFTRPPAPGWPDATLGLLLYHRTVYAGLAAITQVTPLDLTRVRDDLDLARTMLPDVRLGWLATAATAAAEGRGVVAASSTALVTRSSRGVWEESLAAILGALGQPMQTRDLALQEAARRTPWSAGLCAAFTSRATTVG